MTASLEFLGTAPGAIGTDADRGAPLAGRRTRYACSLKPVLDVVAALILLLLLAPLLAGVALTVRLALGSGVVFRQQRVGRGGRSFTVLKFRTMLDESPSGSCRGLCPSCATPCHKCPNDPRHTPAGRLLRRFSLDELPQLFNVLRGEMSLVGPRPELPEIVARYEPWQFRRHLVKPGLTGLWQVSQRGNGVPMHEATGVDIEYVEGISLRTDLSILVRTVPSLLRHHRGT